MRVSVWRVRHPVQNFVGRAYRLFGAGARRKVPAWRYPVTWAAYRTWSAWQRP